MSDDGCSGYDDDVGFEEEDEDASGREICPSRRAEVADVRS